MLEEWRLAVLFDLSHEARLNLNDKLDDSVVDSMQL